MGCNVAELLRFLMRTQSLSHVTLFVTPWTVAHQGRLSMGLSQQEYQSGLPFPSSGDPPKPGMEPASLVSPALAGRFFTTGPEAPLDAYRRPLPSQHNCSLPICAENVITCYILVYKNVYQFITMYTCYSLCIYALFLKNNIMPILVITFLMQWSRMGDGFIKECPDQGENGSEPRPVCQDWRTLFLIIAVSVALQAVLGT